MASEKPSEIVEAARALFEFPIRENIPGSSLTTFSIGGPCDVLAEPQSIEHLCQLLEFLKKNQVAYKMLGAGSNVLIGDSGVREWLIRLGRGFRAFERLDSATGVGRIEVGGAYSLMSLSRELSEDGFLGLGFAGGIPASFGGAIRMNAGAHGGEIGELLKEVLIVTADGEYQRVPADQFNFTYRRTSIPESCIIVGGVIELKVGRREEAVSQRIHCLEERKARQPLSMPSAGSVFKNPSPEQSAGSLIERAGLKGRVCGGAQISELHANWIVNVKKKAKAVDVVTLMELCREEVKKQFQIELVAEVRVWGQSEEGKTTEGITERLHRGGTEKI